MMCADCGVKPAFAKGLCKTCYARQRRKAGCGKSCSVGGCSLPAVSRGMCSKHAQQRNRQALKRCIADLDSEKWVEIENHPKWMISTMGRVKSLRGLHERLIIPRIVNGRLFIEDKKHGGFTVHLQVLRTFRPEVTGDPVFIDGNILNPCLDNLRWDTRAAKINRAIAMAELSTSQWGPAFAAYWRGNKDALDEFFVEMKARLSRMLNRRLEQWSQGYHLSVDEVAHVTLVKLFFAIHSATIIQLDQIVSYALAVADTVLKRHWRYSGLLVAMSTQREDGVDVSMLDASGWCSPSAELVAIGRE